MGMIERKKSILLNEPHLATASGSIVTFDTDMRSKLKECKINFLPVQSGSGDPSPSNVRPISGWTELTIKQTGKNIFDEQYPNIPEMSNVPVYRSIFVGDSMVTVSTSCPRNANNYAVLYALSGKKTSGANSSVNDIYDGLYRTAQPTDGWITIAYRTSTNNADPRLYNTQIEYGTIPTAYEPCTGQEIPVSWQSEAGTLYGGYVDLASGELIADMVMVTYDGSSDESWNVEALSHGKNFYIRYSDMTPIPVKGQYKNDGVVCNQAITRVRSSISSDYTQGMWFISDSGALNIALSTATGSDTVANFKTYLEGHPLQVTYKLATPQIYQLTSQAIKTLIGRNNIWSDAGNVEVKYWKH